MLSLLLLLFHVSLVSTIPSFPWWILRDFLYRDWTAMYLHSRVGCFESLTKGQFGGQAYPPVHEGPRHRTYEKLKDDAWRFVKRCETVHWFFDYGVGSSLYVCMQWRLLGYMVRRRAIASLASSVRLLKLCCARVCDTGSSPINPNTS